MAKFCSNHSVESSNFWLFNKNNLKRFLNFPTLKEKSVTPNFVLIEFHNFGDLCIKLCDTWVIISMVSFLEDSVNLENSDMGALVFKILNVSMPQ